MPQTTIEVFHPLARFLVPLVPPIEDVPKAVADVRRYLDDRDRTTVAVLAGRTLKAYLYFLHEHVEVLALARHLDKTPTPGKKPGQIFTPVSAPPPKDAWLANYDTLDRNNVVAVADRYARLVEAHVERAFARMLLGNDLSVASLVWSIEVTSNATESDPAHVSSTEQVIWGDTARVAGGLPKPGDEEIDRAREIRRKLHALDAASLRRFGGLPHLALLAWWAAGLPLAKLPDSWRAATESWRAASSKQPS